MSSDSASDNESNRSLSPVRGPAPTPGHGLERSASNSPAFGKSNDIRSSRSRSGTPGSHPSGSPKSQRSGSGDSHRSGSQASRRSGSQASNRSGSQASNRSGSQASHRSGSQVSQRSGSQVSHTSKRSGSHVSRRSGSPGSRRSASQASNREGSAVSNRNESPASNRAGSAVSHRSGSAGSNKSVASNRSGSAHSKRSGSAHSKRSGSAHSKRSGSAHSKRSGSSGSKRSGSASPTSKRSGSVASNKSEGYTICIFCRSKSKVRSGSNSPNLLIDEGEGGEKRERDSSEERVVTKKRKAVVSDSEDEGGGKGETEKVDAADIFGDADDISLSSEDEKRDERMDSDREDDRDGRRSRSDDGRRSRSGDEADQRPTIADDEDKENEPEPIPETRIDVEVPKITCDLGRDIHFVKLPNFLSVETRPFDPETYEDEIDEEETLDEEGRARLKLKVENTIRWKESMDDEGNMKKESNARIVRWSDGSYSLHLGSEIFDVYKQPLQKEEEKLRQSASKPKTTRKKSDKASRALENTFVREEEGSDDDGAISLAAIKSKYKGGSTAPKGGAIYSSDEDGSDFENSRTKKKGTSGKALKDSDEEDNDDNDNEEDEEHDSGSDDE
uniref:Another transcription unit protein n=1 Tax=Diabrotica virgifera virgifera TaxID=50390 RepID=A0A6P7H0P6_DIAVI